MAQGVSSSWRRTPRPRGGGALSYGLGCAQCKHEQSQRVQSSSVNAPVAFPPAPNPCIYPIVPAPCLPACLWLPSARTTGIQIIFYFLFGNNMIAFSFVLSSLFGSSRTSTVVAFIYVFATGLIGELLLKVRG